MITAKIASKGILIHHIFINDELYGTFTLTEKDAPIVDAVEKKLLLLFNLFGDDSPNRPQGGLASDFIVSAQALPDSGCAVV